MTRILARPYRTVRAQHVMPDAWELAYGDAIDRDPSELRGWDYATEVVVSRDIEVDVEGVLADCGLPAGTAVGLVICWHADGTGTRGTSQSMGVVRSAATHTSVRLPTFELAGRLELASRLVLLMDLEVDDPLVPHRAGSILWESRTHRVALEGSLARFPVSVIDFADHPHLANGALWGLGWNPQDLDRPALGALCLYLNRVHPAQEPLATGHASADMTSALRVDIARSMIDGALDDTDFDRSDAGEPESLREVINRLFEVIFPGLDTATVRELRRSRRSYFESTIQAVVGMGWEQ